MTCRAVQTRDVAARLPRSRMRAERATAGRVTFCDVICAGEVDEMCNDDRIGVFAAHRNGSGRAAQLALPLRVRCGAGCERSRSGTGARAVLRLFAP
jgi:hypothetical protein